MGGLHELLIFITNPHRIMNDIRAAASMSYNNRVIGYGFGMRTMKIRQSSATQLAKPPRHESPFGIQFQPLFLQLLRNHFEYLFWPERR